VVFKYKEYESRIIKMQRCNVSYSETANYGTDYCYATLNKAIGEAIVQAGLKMDVRVTLQDPKVSGGTEYDDQWWMTINGLKGRTGIVDNNGEFEPKDLGQVMQQSKHGAVMNFDLVFSIRLTKENNKERGPTDTFNIIPECSRGAIKSINLEIEPPNVETQIPTQKAVKDDVASDELVNALNALLS
ncbi:uncharacterized protein PV06_11917, partial [Exophiala oligosperma]